MLVGLPPFYDVNKNKMYEKIVKSLPKFPSHVTSNARDLLLQLLNKDPSKRLGANGLNEIKSHPYCSDIDWEAL